MATTHTTVKIKKSLESYQTAKYLEALLMNDHTFVVPPRLYKRTIEILKEYGVCEDALKRVVVSRYLPGSDGLIAPPTAYELPRLRVE